MLSPVSASIDLATKTTTELIRIATGGAELPVRALATWYAVGTHPRQTKHLSARPGEPAALFDGLCEAGLPHTAVEIAREGFRKIGEPLCPFVALLCPLATVEASTIQDDVVPPQTMIGEVPSYAYDMYVREGRSSLQTFLQGDSETTRWIVAHVPKGQRVNFLGTVVFRVEGGLVRQRSRWSKGDELRRLVDLECHGPNCPDATEILRLMRNEISPLNDERSHVG